VKLILDSKQGNRKQHIEVDRKKKALIISISYKWSRRNIQLGGTYNDGVEVRKFLERRGFDLKPENREVFMSDKDAHGNRNDGKAYASVKKHKRAN